MAKAKVETNPAEQTIERLQERYRELHTKKIQADTNLDNARKNLDALKEEARQKFGTDDVDELKAKLRALQEENEQKRTSYQDELDRIEADLATVETNLSAMDDAEGASREKP